MSPPKKTTAEKLPELVQWWLGDKSVELTYERNATRRGKIIPEFDCIYWLDGRRVTAQAVSMMMVADFMELNHRYTYAQITSAIMKFTWNHYLTAIEYTDELREFVPKKKPMGRPPNYPEQAK